VAKFLIDSRSVLARMSSSRRSIFEIADGSFVVLSVRPDAQDDDLNMIAGPRPFAGRL